ncbi:SMI1/KNR4 family protein [Roseomonas aerophila]|uniref:SMI1/KNR4 family protein n=1 Tax=Teichococcus aerophilus TaxID=1224513 RepID=A0ABR7RTW3_9PROT|nr:SMI1/KNR4 family protein [Pseudoroseomonas aerophila]MBC9209636.1 SMI1/KNR4 family protein [Pseudoroseomonas aerophila]
MWEPYLRAVLPDITDAHRQRLEALLGSPLPDRYWDLACQHQGEGLNEEVVADPQFATLILLLVVPPGLLDAANASYCVETRFRQIQNRYPAGLLPFADDTGGNVWAFDTRTRPGDPAVVFIDHEHAGEDGIFPVAPDFDAFMAMLETGM